MEILRKYEVQLGFGEHTGKKRERAVKQRKKLQESQQQLKNSE